MDKLEIGKLKIESSVFLILLRTKRTKQTKRTFQLSNFQALASGRSELL